MKNEEKGKGKGFLFGTFVGKTVGSIIALLGITKSLKKLREDTLLNQSGNILSENNKASTYIQDGTSESHNIIKKNVDSVMDQSRNVPNETMKKAELYVETGTPEIHNKDNH